MRKILFFIFYFLPFLFWFLMINESQSLIVVYQDIEDYLILTSHELWPIVLTFFVFTLVNLLLTLLFSQKNIFGKINFIFTLFHYFVVFKIFLFNFF